MQHEEDRERIRKQDDDDRKRHDEEDRVAVERGLATAEELAKARAERGMHYSFECTLNRLLNQSEL